jgi:hypothetical protein
MNDKKGNPFNCDVHGKLDKITDDITHIRISQAEMQTDVRP